MVAYDLDKTLSDNGTVSRGVCGVDAAGNLTSMVERTQIERMPDGRIVFHDGGADEVLAEDTPVSMNLFGFTPDFFTYSREYFKTWLARNKENLKAEFYIPTMVNKLVGEGTASLRVLRSAAQTQPGDSIRVQLQVGALHCTVNNREDAHGKTETDL